MAESLRPIPSSAESGLTELDSRPAHLDDAQSLFALEGQAHELLAGGASASEAMIFGQDIEALNVFKEQVTRRLSQSGGEGAQ